MQLMCSVFNTESALVAIVEDESIFIADSINFKRGDFPWRRAPGYIAVQLAGASIAALILRQVIDVSASGCHGNWMCLPGWKHGGVVMGRAAERPFGRWQDNFV